MDTRPETSVTPQRAVSETARFGVDRAVSEAVRFGVDRAVSETARFRARAVHGWPGDAWLRAAADARSGPAPQIVGLLAGMAMSD